MAIDIAAAQARATDTRTRLWTGQPIPAERLHELAGDVDHLAAKLAELADQLHKANAQIHSLEKATTASANEVDGLRKPITEAVIADREAQASSPEVVNAVAFTLEMELRAWLGPHFISDEHLRRIAARLMGSAAWVRPAAPGCDCSATGGQGLVPTASREHADDCPAVTR